jgi:hypothetical protein
LARLAQLKSFDQPLRCCHDLPLIQRLERATALPTLHAGALADETQALCAIGIEPEFEVVGCKIDVVRVEEGGCVAGAKVVLHAPDRGYEVATWVAEPTVRHVQHACKDAICEQEVRQARIPVDKPGAGRLDTERTIGRCGVVNDTKGLGEQGHDAAGWLGVLEISEVEATARGEQEPLAGVDHAAGENLRDWKTRREPVKTLALGLHAGGQFQVGDDLLVVEHRVHGAVVALPGVSKPDGRANNPANGSDDPDL